MGKMFFTLISVSNPCNYRDYKEFQGSGNSARSALNDAVARMDFATGHFLAGHDYAINIYHSEDREMIVLPGTDDLVFFKYGKLTKTGRITIGGRWPAESKHEANTIRGRLFRSEFFNSVDQ